MSPMLKSTPTAAERRAPRERAFLQARLSYADGAMSLPCAVIQISATGAKLMLPEELTLPEKFRIVIAQKGIDCPARLIWRRGGHGAIAFQLDEAGAPAKSVDAYRARVRELEAENASLREKVAQLTARLKQSTEAY